MFSLVSHLICHGLWFPGMEEEKILDDHLTSAAAFVEGGIQDACDDACSICLEVFSESEPSTVHYRD